MKSKILEVYALTVCFVTLTCFAITGGIAIYNVIMVSKPELTIANDQYLQYQSNDNYWRSLPVDKAHPQPRPAEAKLTQQRQQAKQQMLEAEQREGWQSLLQKAIILLIDLVLFVFHWQLAKRCRQANN